MWRARGRFVQSTILPGSCYWLIFSTSLWGVVSLSGIPIACSDVAVVILSQPEATHIARAEKSMQLMQSQCLSLGGMVPKVLLAHEHYSQPEVMTIIPLLAKVYLDVSDSVQWFLLATEDTQVDFSNLGSLLQKYNSEEPVFLGHALHDSVPAIIHHFAFLDNLTSMAYPLLCAGIVFNRQALQRISEHLHQFDPSFTIDPSYELALFLRYMEYVPTSSLHPTPPPIPPHGLVISHAYTFFCSKAADSDNCAAWCSANGDFGCPAEKLERVFFAVKTCEHYHTSRLSVVKDTWGKTPRLRVRYYSNHTDTSLGTVDIGVPNTLKGHCAKTMAIIEQIAREKEVPSWLVIADDDTLFSIPRLLSFLGCYDPNSLLLLGEVYGYKASSNGYLFITGGGGIVLSEAAVKTIRDECPTPDYPDDMFLGRVAFKRGISIVHSPLFHQNQPSSYSRTLLSTQLAPISFHRHSPDNPRVLYKELLQNHYVLSTESERPLKSHTQYQKFEL